MESERPAAQALRPRMAGTEVAGEAVLFDPSGALWLPDHATLVVSDLHLEKGSSYAVRGVYLPPYDSRVTLERLTRTCAGLAPKRIIALGDSFHDRGAPARLEQTDVATIRTLTASAEWIWIAGNHDPAPPRAFGGAVAQTVTIGGLTFRHEPCEDEPALGEVAGHLHPVASIRVRGRRVRRRCFVSDGTRLVLPAFGAYAGGLCVLNEAYAPLFPDGLFQAFVLGKERIYPLSAGTLVPDQVPAGPTHWRL
ncbi:MAG: ligase-associated DNA damage response endonuclease PdeM [Alphaproteobacteria bacterium]